MTRFFTFAALLATTNVFGQFSDEFPTDGLVAWFPLEGNILNVMNPDQEVEGMCEWTVGRSGLVEDQAALFSDPSHILNGDATGFPANERTVSVWMNSERSSAGDFWGYGGGGPGQSSMLYIGNDCGGSSSALTHSASYCQSVTKFELPDSFFSTWSHVVLTVSDNQRCFYVNGVLAICSNASTNAAFDGVFAIGSSIDYNGENYGHFDGALEDIGLWDRTLSAEEVEILFNATSLIFGCTDPEACNYNSAATADAGNCLILDVCGECGGDNSTCVGCTDPEACNFDPAAVIDSEEESSCTYPADGQTCDDLCVLALPDTIVQCFNSSTLIEAGVQRGTFFDGVDDWILTSESGVTGMSPMSVSFWALTDHNGAMDIFTQATDEDSWADIRFGMNTPQCGLVGPSFKSPAHFATFPYPVDNRNWHHYAYVLGDGSMSFSNLKIYVDGELHAASTGEEFCGHNWGGWTYDAADVPIRFGVGLPLGGFYSGYLDDMALWSKALSQNEVFEIMANDALVVSEDLVSFWPLDQLEDGFFLDMVGNNHGAPVGGVGTETPLPQGVISWFNGSQMPNLVVTPNQTTAYSIQSVLESGQVCADTTVVEVIDFEYADLNGNGICDQLEGEGCMDPVACNYSEFALVDNGSCDFSCCPGPGCCISPNVWDPATQMCVNTAASCGEGTVWDESLQQCLPEDMCFADLDNDGLVGMADLLDLLTQFGFECAE